MTEEQIMKVKHLLLELSEEGDGRVWSRLRCPECEEVFDVEGDVSNGEEVECDACPWTGPVDGR